MDRKFVIALSSLVGSMMLTEAHAVGLGEIKLRTNLNEPLRADIQLMQVKDLSENEILVNLASKEEFAKAGVDRDFLLNSLHFRLDLADPKNPKVVVTTEQPIREPYLNFLLEVQWPSGRLLREYTLLMDLPAFADTAPSGARSVKGTLVPEGVALPRDEGVSEVGKAPAQTSAPVQKPAPAVAASKPAAEVAPEANSAAPAPVSEPEVKQSSKAAASMGVVVRRATKDEIQHYRAAASSSAAAEPAPVASQEPVASKPADEAAAKTAVADGHYGPTQSDDTLWKIAQRVRPSSSISMHQTMVAIQMLNPQAFNKGNINQLKKGQVLKLPSQEEITSIGQAEAVASVNNQVNEWKGQQAQQSPTGGQQLDATGKAAPVAPAAAPSDGQLKLAAPAESNTATASKAAGNSEVAALQSQLSTGMEELSRAQREHQDMSSRAQDLDGQIANAEKLMNLQSGELAALQAKLAAEQQAKADADAKAKA